MLSIEIVVAAMNQHDFSLVDKMNVDTDIVIANQADEFSYKKGVFKSKVVKMITTSQRGVGLNRNIGLDFATGDLLMLSDEDIVYHDGYEEVVKKAFEELPDADLIIFQMQFKKNGVVYDVDRHKTKRLHMWNGLGYGTYQIVVRKKSLDKANIHFTHLFGGGCIYSAGEDSLFLIDCFKKGLKAYSYAGLIGDNIRDQSSWFRGFTKKFFFDRGAFAACAFPKFGNLICLYYLFAYRKIKTCSMKEKYRLMRAGFKGFKKLLTFEQWIQEHE